MNLRRSLRFYRDETIDKLIASEVFERDELPFRLLDPLTTVVSIKLSSLLFSSRTVFPFRLVLSCNILI